MKKGLLVGSGIVIPGHELKIVSTELIGPSGRYSNPRVLTTVHWNVKKTNVLSVVQKKELVKKLSRYLTKDGVLTTTSTSSRGIETSEKFALKRLVEFVSKIF